MHTVHLYFFGDFRPLVFQGTDMRDTVALAVAAVAGTDRGEYFANALNGAATDMLARGYSAVSRERSTCGVSIRKGPHDSFLDNITRTLPHYPRADYSAVVNVGVETVSA